MHPLPDFVEQLDWPSRRRCCVLAVCRPAARDRPYLSDRFFFVTVRLLRRRRELNDADFRHLVLGIRRARAVHPFLMSAWVFLADPAAAGHAICAPQYPGWRPDESGRQPASPDQRPWSSFRFYFLGDDSVLPMDRLP